MTRPHPNPPRSEEGISRLNAAELLALEKRLVDAVEGSCELDAMIEAQTALPMTNWPKLLSGLSYSFEVSPDDERRVTAYATGALNGKPFKQRHAHYAPPLYTSSIDAALALVSRVLPTYPTGSRTKSWGREHRREQNKTEWTVSLWNDEAIPLFILAEATHQSEAMAACLALVRALIRALTTPSPKASEKRS